VTSTAGAAAASGRSRIGTISAGGRQDWATSSVIRSVIAIGW
jgi:hypothetical protein